jgi:agmatine deiminase
VRKERAEFWRSGMRVSRRDFSSLMAAATAGMLVPPWESRAEATSPAGLGFFAPSEEAPHARTWMAWPTDASIYAPAGDRAYFESVQVALGRVAAAIAENEEVVLAAPLAEHAVAAPLCGPKVKLVDIPTDDMWARDSGPVFLIDGRGGKALTDFNFNGWGRKQRYGKDGHLAATIASITQVRRFEAPVTGEGGGIEYDGQGTLILTESSWINENRNPGLRKMDLERHLMAYLGVRTLVWLPGVRNHDITDYHIDGYCRIVRPGVLLFDRYRGDDPEFIRNEKESLAILRKARDAQGRSFEIAFTQSAVKVRSRRRDFFSGYSNYYVGNGAIYTPVFGDEKADAAAHAQLRRLYPGRRIVALEVDRIYENGGGIHCVTQQEPL